MNTQISTNQVTENPCLQLRDIRRQLSALKKLEDAVKDQITTIMDAQGTDALEIDNVRVSRSMSERTVFDSAAAKSFLGAKASEFEKQQIIVTMSVR